MSTRYLSQLIKATQDSSESKIPEKDRVLLKIMIEKIADETVVDGIIDLLKAA
jgi:hypothetical protein